MRKPGNKSKKLDLDKTTLRQLTPDKLGGVQGGMEAPTRNCVGH